MAFVASSTLVVITEFFYIVRENAVFGYFGGKVPILYHLAGCSDVLVLGNCGRLND